MVSAQVQTPVNLLIWNPCNSLLLKVWSSIESWNFTFTEGEYGWRNKLYTLVTLVLISTSICCEKALEYEAVSEAMGLKNATSLRFNPVVCSRALQQERPTKAALNGASTCVRLSVLERKISTRQTREELIEKGVLILDQGESVRSLPAIRIHFARCVCT